MEPTRVLVVDDEGELTDTLVERLNLRGLEAEGVTSGAAALRAIKERPFDVVLLDVKMPGVSGLDVVREIKAQKPSPEVILLTGHGSAKDAREGLRLGAREYLMKPIQIEALMRALLEAAEAKNRKP